MAAFISHNQEVAVPAAPSGRHVRLLRRFAEFEPGEGRSVALFFTYAFLLLVCYYILKTLREPLLLRAATPASKSYAYAAVALVLFVLVPVYGAVFRRAANARVAVWVTAFFVVNLLGFCVATRLGIDVGFVYYVWVGVFGVTIVAQFWAHAADAFDVGSGQRLFPTIMAGATLGGLAGPLVVRALYDAAAPWSLLLVATALLAATLPLIGWTRASVPPESRSRARREGTDVRGAHARLGGFALILRDRYLLLLAALAVLLNCVNTTGEYLLTELVVRHADEQIALQASLDKGALIAKFYGDYFFAVNALTALTQVLLVGRVFRWIGVQGALLVLPVVALLGYGLVLFVPIFAILRIVKIAENCADYSVANTARQALFLPLPTDAKYEGKIAIDTFLWRCGDLLQAGIVFAGLHWLGFGVRHFALLNVVLGIAWLAVAVQLARRYSARTAKHPASHLADSILPRLGVLAGLALSTLGVRRAALARGFAAVVLAVAGTFFLTGSAPAHADLPPFAVAGRPGLPTCRGPDRGCSQSSPSENAVRAGNLPSWDAYAKLPPRSTTRIYRVRPLEPGLGGSLRGISRMTFAGHAMRAPYAARAAAFVTLAAGGLAFGQSRTPDPAQPVRLREGNAATAEQRSGEKITYAFDAAPGRTYLVEVEQHGLDFSLSIEGPDGEARAFNSPLFRDEPEFALIENAKAARYRVTIVSDEATNAVGSHAITVAPLDAGVDARQLDAWRLMSDGARANKESRGKDALAAYEGAARRWHELSETSREAQAIYSAAMVRYWSADLYDWEGAAKQAKAAAALYDRIGARGLYADAMLTAGYSSMEVAQGAGSDAQHAFDDALAAFRESYAVHESLGDAYGLAHVENFTGLAFYNRGQFETRDFRQAETHYRHAIDLFAKLGEWREELNTRQNLALISVDEGRAASATRMFEAILADIPDGRDPLFRGIVLANLGVAYRNSGDFNSALRVLTEAVKIDAAKNEFGREGFALLVLGGTYFGLGELDRAAEYLRQALEKSANDSRVLSSVLNTLGNVAYKKGDYVAALDWHRRSVESTASALDRAQRETFVARDLVALRRFNEAIETSGAVLARADSAAITRADSALELGYAYLGLDDAKEADRHLAMALAVYEAGGLRAEEAESLRGRALAARASGDLAAAARYGERALEKIEALRTNVGAPELRAYYAAAHGDYYELQIDLLVGAHRDAGDAPESLLAALSVSERARARMLVDLLAEASIRLDRGVPSAVLERERELYDELGALRSRRDRFLESPALDHSALDPLLERMNAIENELALVAIDARQHGSVRPGSSPVAPLSARDIQSLLDDRSVLLQYSLGADRSFAWIVTRSSVRLAELAGRETIEPAARLVQQSLKTYRADRGDGELAAQLHALSNLVLAPLLPYVGSHERVLVAADGALDYVPFGVLPVARDGAPIPMLQAFEVVNVPSMSVVATQRRRADVQPTKALAVFADPVFSSADPRLALAAPPSSPLDADRHDGPQLARLAASGVEASAIAALVPPASRLVATGIDASRERVLSAPLADYRIVHFATHGLVDSEYPGLSALALSQVDAAGRPADGMLRLQDIYRLSLNADLVVLSGCDTALGREIRGEGLIGLVDGFLYAGARSLVVSLWQVPDRATSELMARFYTYILKDGLRPAEALGRAQRSIAAERRWSDPYFWGAFIVLGDS